MVTAVHAGGSPGGGYSHERRRRRWMEGLGSTAAKALEIGEIINHFCYVVSQAFGQTHIGYPYSQQKITSCMLKTVCVLHEFDQEKIRNQMQKQLKHQPRHILAV
jgi:hypothetical protein